MAEESQLDKDRLLEEQALEEVQLAEIDVADSLPMYTPVDFEGSVSVGGVERDVSRRVYQRDDIDWDFVNPETGETNREGAKRGLAPIGRDGNPIELHHLLQDEPGAMVEVLASVHDRGMAVLHRLKSDGESFRNDPDLAKQYNNFRRAYWKRHAGSTD